MPLIRYEPIQWNAVTEKCYANKPERIKPSFVMPLIRYEPIQLKTGMKIDTLEWGIVRPAAAVI